MRIVIEPPKNTRPDPVIESQSLATRVKLSPNVQHVKAGTPLRPSALGWEPAREGSHIVLFAANTGYGGDEVTVCRELVLNVNNRYLVPCARYKVGDIDATGYTTFAPDADGPFFALTDTTILLSPEL